MPPIDRLSPGLLPNTAPAANAEKPVVAAKEQLEVVAPPAVADTVRSAVADSAAKRLLGTVTKNKDVEGDGMEWTGAGNPRVNERRGMLSVLLAAKTNQLVDVGALEKLSDKVKVDIDWLRAAERTDYAIDGKDQFTWSKNPSSTPEVMQGEFDQRIKAGRAAASALMQGKQRFFDTQGSTMVGVAFLKDSELKAKALADILLQFRGLKDNSSSSARIANIGPAAIAEQRIVLAESDLSGNDAKKMRDYALLRLAIGSHPLSSMNGIFEARNSVAKMEKNGLRWVMNDTAPGATYCAYESIHHNFSGNTPKNIEMAIAHFVFTKGPIEERAQVFHQIVAALQTARQDKNPSQAKETIAQLAQQYPEALEPLRLAVMPAQDGEVADRIVDFLKSAAVKPLGQNPEENLVHADRLYQAVWADQPSLRTIEGGMFKAGGAWPEIADVVARMRDEDTLGLLKDLGTARLALRSAVIEAKTGYERHEVLKFDAQIDRLTCQELGSAVERVGNLETDAQKSEALLALQTALRSAVASGLQEIRDVNDSAAQKGRSLAAISSDVDAVIARGSISSDTYRALMAEAYVSVQRVVQNMRHFFDTRTADVAAGAKTQLDPEFLDQLVKQSALHYATALAQKGMAAGLTEEIGAREVKNITGMRVLNSIGPVVFTDVVMAENTTELIKLQPPRGALTILYALSEKKMVAVGGLIADVKDAPGGNSHLNMYAMNNGIPVLALPELRTKYKTFFENGLLEGGIYLDDSKGEFSMMTVGLAKERGIIADKDIAGLKPGTNKLIKYLKPEGDGFKVFAEHAAMLSPSRPTREIELYMPMAEVKGIGRESTSFLDVAKLGTQGRHLAGEKGLVLALLKADPALGKYVPDGSIVTTGRIKALLKEAGIERDWDAIWTNDPVVGIVDDQNFVKSAFYTDATYRAQKREHLQHLTRQKLDELLVTKDAQNKEILTPAGERLYRELEKNPALAQSNNWIARSSFTGEDRPNKSGAGQYESFPHLKDPVSRVKGIVGVIESAWMPEPVENNVSDQINLMHIMPSVVVQHCLNPERSGVMISRDVEHGARGVVSYQLVKGFGGGVEGGKTEEGSITGQGHTVKIEYPGEKQGLVPAAALIELRDIVLGTEKFFNDTVEPGRGHAVDMEVAFVGGKWNIVQARVIGMDK